MKRLEEIAKILLEEKVKIIITIPCKSLAGIIKLLEEKKDFRVVYPSREEEGLGISAGCSLGGMKSVMFIQNSGLGNMVNAFKSLIQYYKIPFFAVVSHRGGKEELVGAQKPMGRVTPKLLKTLGVKYRFLRTRKDIKKIRALLRESFSENKSCVLLSTPGFWREFNEKI